jgi:hypothetical protein
MESDDDVPTPEALAFWLKNYEDDDMIAAMIDDHTLEAALINDGFDAYYAAVYPKVSHIIDNCREVLNRIENAETPDDQIVAVLAAFHLEHHSGNVLRDYGDDYGIDYRDVQRICEEGLTAIFDSERITTFLLGDPVSI